ncbi:Ribosomal large subunit pseudouridine synthase B [Phycisphaerae bacterium RAS1]|nr:Ribosomal large subunit pseudouridine synthase B [Phycisphaerae bacterium RAS1]
MPSIRLQRFLSDAGVASRRHAEELILEGRVLVNNRIVETLPAFVDPKVDRVIVDGGVVRVQPLAYFIMHKPKKVVCTNKDPSGRLRAIDLLPPDLPQRLFPVGRLDADGTGLLLLTNDGELTERLTHPRYGLAKVYRVEVRGKVTAETVERLRRGVYTSEGKARLSEVELSHAGADRSVLMVTVREGRERLLPRMLANVGHPVKALKRLQVGPLELKGLPLGACRQLSDGELRLLREAIDESYAAAKRERHEKRRRRGGPPKAGARGAGRGSTGGARPRPAGQPSGPRGAAGKPRGATSSSSAARGGASAGQGGSPRRRIIQ